MFNCDICGSVLNSRGSLYVHYKSQMHRDNLKSLDYKIKNNKYCCKCCMYFTNYKSSFSNHLLTKKHSENMNN
jgi:hypothetical protein